MSAATDTPTVSAVQKGTTGNLAKVIASYALPGYVGYLVARYFVYFPAGMAPIADFLGFHTR